MEISDGQEGLHHQTGEQEGAHLQEGPVHHHTGHSAELEVEEGGDMARMGPDETGANNNCIVVDEKGVGIVVEIVDETSGVIVENKYD